jgi:Probable Zinc-ribbon domain
VSLGLKRYREWKKYTEHNALPNGIPAAPNLVYDEWINWQYWLTGDANLFKDHPLFSEVHPTKNKNVDFSSVVTGSKIKIWWLCKTCGESWDAIIRDRANKNTGCRFCSGQEVSRKTSVGNSPAMSLWHPTKNKGIDPFSIYKNSTKKFWWLQKECGHEWNTASPKAINAGQRCPKCAGKVVCEDNCLDTEYPYISKMLDAPRNGGITGRDVVPGSHTKLHWITPKGKPRYCSVKDMVSNYKHYEP